MLILIMLLTTCYAVNMARAGLVTGDAVQAVQLTGTNYFLGKVGVGTNNPLYQLHVIGTMKVTGPLRVPRQGDLLMGSYTNGEPDEGASSAGADLPSGSKGNFLFHNGTNWIALTNLYYDSTTSRLYLNNTNSGIYLDAGGLEGQGASFYRNWLNITNKTTFGGVGQSGIILSTTNDAGKFLKADGTWQSIVSEETDPTVTNCVRKSVTLAVSPGNNAILVSDGSNNTWSLNFNGTFDGQEGTFYRDWNNITNKEIGRASCRERVYSNV